MIAIIDYGAGNLRSVEKALNYLGTKMIITSDEAVIKSSNAVVLPGVGAFEDAVRSLREKNLEKIIKEVISKGTPFLGICLGMQMLFEYSEEGETIVNGLGIFEGSVKRIPEKEGLKIPHIGWNNVITKDEKNELYFYFVHSYYVDAKDKSIVTGILDYGTTLDVMIEKDNVLATQFHPEKSGKVGLELLRRFVERA